MPLNEIPRHLNPDARRIVETALEEAWQELNKGRHLDRPRVPIISGTV